MEEVGQKLARKLEKKLVTTVEEVGQILEMGFCLIFTQICWLSKLGCASFLHIGVLSNISNMRCSVSSPDETPRRELKIRRAAEYF